MTRSPHRTRVFILGIVLGALTIGCGSDSDTPVIGAEYASTRGSQVSITRARTPIPPEGQTNTAVYGIIANETDAPITILSASSPAAERVELQRPVDDSALETVTGGVVVAVEGGIVMEPGDLQLTLIGVDRTAFGDPVPIVLQLDTGDEFAFEATPVEVGE